VAGAQEVAGRIIAGVDLLAMPHRQSTTAGHVTVSIGVAACTPAPAQAPAQLLAVADAALYTAKQGGRHRVVGRAVDAMPPA
jgi:diguanylate cyclase (GGDEF)-like protein